MMTRNDAGCERNARCSTPITGTQSVVMQSQLQVSCVLAGDRDVMASFVCVHLCHWDTRVPRINLEANLVAKSRRPYFERRVREWSNSRGTKIGCVY